MDESVLGSVPDVGNASASASASRRGPVVCCGARRLPGRQGRIRPAARRADAPPTKDGERLTVPKSLRAAA
ncbi:hypothetical protein [Streptomyces iakyrus]